ncbi:MAG: nuclear transport factor 2 family protein [Novosphingobium sp.]
MTKSVEERLTEIESKLALYDLMHDYQRLGDEKRYREWAECWTEDAVFENSFGSLHGKQEIFEACDGQMKVFQDQEHLVGNTLFRVSGDEATGTGVLIFIGVPDVGQPGEHVITGGHYDWRFRKTDDGWKISYAYLRFVWSKGDRSGMFTTPT